LLGVATVVAQTLLLREAMAAMGGSELAWGAVMALWLVGMGTGARVGAVAGSARLARAVPVVVLMFTGCGAVLFRAAPAMIGAASGETLATASAVWLWVAAVFPAAFAGGLAFPILAGVLGEGGGGRTYALEAAGALVGGVLVTAALVGLGAAPAVCLGLGCVTAVVSWPRSRWLAALAAIAGVVLAAPAASLLERAGWSWSGHPGALRNWQETRLQRLELSGGPPLAVYADGTLLSSYPDPYVVLPRAHLTMLLHEDPRRVYAVGCVADGSVEAMAHHPVARLVVVEEDPLLLRRLPGWYGPEMAAALAGPRTLALAGDPTRAL
jgi:MFS family permease